MYFKNVKRWLSLIAAAAIVLGLVACGQGGAATTTTAPAQTPSVDASESADQPSEPAGSEPDDASASQPSFDNVTITAMIFDRSNAPEGQGTVVDNRWTKYVNEEMNKMGVSVEFIPVPRSEEGTKVPTMVSTQSAADLMMTYDYAMVRKFYEDGGLHQLGDVLEQYGQDLKAYLGEDCLAIGRNDKGEQFAIPARRATTASTNFFIRKDWLDKLNLEIPETIDEFYDAMTAFKEQDPGGIGSERVIASSVGLASRIFPKAFFTKMDDIKYYQIHAFSGLSGLCYADRENGLEYFKFRNKMYHEGLMDKEFFTSKNFSQKEKEFAVAGQLGFWEYDVSGNVDTLRGGILQNLKQNVPDAELVAMKPLKNKHDGVVYNPAYPISGAMVFMPLTAKSPEAAMAYLNFLGGEGGFTLFHGIEGEHFDYQDGVPVVKDAEYNADSKDWLRHDIFLVGNQGYYKTEEDFIAATAKELPGWEQYVIDNYNDAIFGTRMPDPTYTSPTQTQQAANVGKVFDDYAVKMVTESPDLVEATFNTMISELEKYEIVKIIEERTEFINAN